MLHLFTRLGGRFFFSKRHKSVRGSVVFIFTNLLLLASLVFFLEIILIFLGIGNFFIPLTHGISEFLSKCVLR
jgi:dolichol kinase